MIHSELVIFGAGGHGKVVVDAALAAGRTVACVADDRPTVDAIEGVRVFSSTSEEWRRLTAEPFEFVVAVGDNANRERIFGELRAAGGRPAIIVHPRAVLARSAVLGDGVVVCAGVVVNPDARIGEDSILNTSCSVDHDCRVGNHVHVCPGVHLGGTVTVGDRSMLGIGAVVLPGRTIGAGVVVGAGAVVHRDLPDLVTAWGVPAVVHRREP